MRIIVIALICFLSIGVLSNVAQASIERLNDNDASGYSLIQQGDGASVGNAQNQPKCQLCWADIEKAEEQCRENSSLGSCTKLQKFRDRCKEICSPKQQPTGLFDLL